MNRPVQIVLATFLIASAASALTVTRAATAPSGASILVAYDATSDLGSYPWVHGSGVAIDLGQTFRLAQDATLDAVTLKVRATTDIARELVTLRIGTYTDGADDSMNEVLRVEGGLLPADMPVGTAVYLTLELASPLALAANRQYGFVLGFTGGGGVNDARAEVLHLGGDLYEQGQAVEDFGAFTDALDADLVFFLHATSAPPTPAPPPPGADERLLLRDGRFEVDAYWRTALGTAGYGKAVALTADTGTFWFFGAENLEIFVKVLDGCVPFERYWVYLAGLTDVEVLVTVRDLQGDAVRTYFSPMGQAFAPVLDAAAFATCP